MGCSSGGKIGSSSWNRRSTAGSLAVGETCRRSLDAHRAEDHLARTKSKPKKPAPEKPPAERVSPRFERTSLRGAVFQDVDLSAASVDDASFANARLTNVDLSETVIDDATFAGASLTNVD